MSLYTLLQPINFLQMLALALSIFNLIAFLWLTFTVWLNGDRRTLIARVGVAGLGLSSLFFFIHALLIFGQMTQTHSSGWLSSDILWHIIWFPALGVPYIWFVIGLHYAVLINERWYQRRPILLLCSAVLGCTVFLLLLLNQSTFTFEGTLRLLAYDDVRDVTKVGIFSPLVLLPVLFLCYVTFCAIGPWFTPSRVGRLLRVLWHEVTGRATGRGGSGDTQESEKAIGLRHRLADAFWDDSTQLDLVEEPMLSWYIARPKLLVAALLMVMLTTSLGVLGVWSMVNWLQTQSGSIPPVDTPPPPLTTLPLNLVLLDIFATGSVALIILLVGYSIVRHGILIERPLARRGFFEQWRGVVIVATAVALFIALLVLLSHSNLGGILLITSLATGAYGLFTWSSYTAHDRYIALLGPFLRSTNLRHWLHTDLEKTEQSMEDLFFHLCQDVLEVQCARLMVLAGPIRRSFTYRWPVTDSINSESGMLVHLPLKAEKTGESTTNHLFARATPTRIRLTLQEQPIICWVLPIYDELGPVATLYLGPRQDGSMFTDEDMDLAHACGQRILDTLRDHEAMQAVAALLRRRIIDVKLLGAQHRRVLHDEILPQMHLALLRLETLRPVVNRCQEDSAALQADVALDEAVERISDAHRRLAAIMRSTTPSAPHRLERDGMMHAIHTMIANDFQHVFDEVEWDVSDDTVRYIDEIVPPAIAELTFAAVQEALRNAARHARGTDIHRRLRLAVKASCNPHLEIIVADDGVGILSASSSTSGTGGGLLTHSALLAVAGGSLTVKSIPNEGVSVRIFLPAETFR